MNKQLADLISLLDLKPHGTDRFVGESRDLGGKSVYGGQVISQALVAASRTVEDRAPHSCHAYFLRAGDMSKDIEYEVDRLRDGRSFAARRVHALQNGKPILSMTASFQAAESGAEHQTTMPEVPPPEKLEFQHVLRRAWADAVPQLPEKYRQGFLRELAIEFKQVIPWNPLAPEVRPPRQLIWFRAADRLPDDPLLHRCVLAYASDFSLLTTALMPHGLTWFSMETQCASLDHALWFHREARVDDWLLYVMEAPTAQDARGLSEGKIFDRAGRLVASVVQESLMRNLRKK